VTGKRRTLERAFERRQRARRHAHAAHMDRRDQLPVGRRQFIERGRTLARRERAAGPADVIDAQ